MRSWPTFRDKRVLTVDGAREIRGYLQAILTRHGAQVAEAATGAEPLPFGLSLAVVLPALGTLVLGLFPGAVLQFASKSAGFLP